MKSCYSVLNFVNNPLSNESIALGIVVVTEQDVYFRVSEAKVDFAKKLNPKCAKLLDFSLRQFRDFVFVDSCDHSDKIIRFEKKVKYDLLQRLSNYNNGILQFSKPLSVNKESFGYEAFDTYFKKFIYEEIESVEIPKSHYISQQKQNVKERLYAPLKDKIDVDFTLKKDKLPTLYFDFHFDSIGVNGAMYAAKSVDLNASKKIADIKSVISEYESVIERLNKFAKRKDINGNHEYYLITDPYVGTSLSYHDLYSLLKTENMPYFKLISSNELDVLVDKVLANNAHKFSDELAEV